LGGEQYSRFKKQGKKCLRRGTYILKKRGFTILRGGLSLKKGQRIIPQGEFSTKKGAYTSGGAIITERRSSSGDFFTKRGSKSNLRERVGSSTGVNVAAARGLSNDEEPEHENHKRRGRELFLFLLGKPFGARGEKGRAERDRGANAGKRNRDA